MMAKQELEVGLEAGFGQVVLKLFDLANICRRCAFHRLPLLSVQVDLYEVQTSPVLAGMRRAFGLGF